MVAFACGSGACWACWGTLSLRSYANFWSVWRVLERLGFGGFEAWQTAALNAYKKPLLRPEGALEPLLWPCGGFCVREWRVLGLLGYLVPAELCELLERLEGFGGFEAWQTAALNAYKKPLLRPEGALEPLLWPCGGFCVREWRVLGLLGYLVPAELCELLERLEGFGGFEAWQTAALNAYKKPLLRPEGALEPLLWPCGGFCVREWRVLGLLGYLVPAELCELLERLEGFGGFEAWQTAALNAYKKPLLRPEGALEPLLWPCGSFCVLGVLEKFHTCGGPRRRPGLGEGRGRRIFGIMHCDVLCIYQILYFVIVMCCIAVFLKHICN